MSTRSIRFVPLFIALALLFALLPSCQKKKAPLPEAPGESEYSESFTEDADSGETGDGEFSESDSGEGEYSEDEDVEGGDPAYQGSEPLTGSFIIRSGAGLYEKGDGGMKWKDTLGIGQNVQVTGGSFKAKIEKAEYDVLPVTLE